MKLLRVIVSGLSAGLLLMAGCNEVHPQIRYRDGLDAYNKGDLTAAMADFESAYRGQPGDANICYWLGRCYLDLAKARAAEETTIAAMTYADKAVFYFESAVQASPSHMKALDGKGEALRIKGEYQRATQTAREVGTQLSPTANVLITKARAYASGGDMDMAMITYRQAVVAEPMNPAALEAYGRALLIAGDRDRGLEYLRKAYEVKPTVAVLDTLHQYGAVPELAPGGGLRPMPLPNDLPPQGEQAYK
jgi:tetratricopeptide (TPR) repeat protein